MCRFLRQHSDPAQQIVDVVFRHGAARDGQRQGDVLGDVEVIEKLLVLVDDPDPPPHHRHVIARKRAGVLPEQRDPSLLRNQVAVAQPQERRLARARRASQKVKRSGGQFERNIGQKRPATIAIAHVFEVDHAVFPTQIGDSFAPLIQLFQSRDCKGLILGVSLLILANGELEELTAPEML